MATLPRCESQEEFVSVREYLTTSYEPDCDYVDGVLEERNLGEHDHAYLQSLLAHFFISNRLAWGIYAITDCRIQVEQTRFRVPDVTVRRIGSIREPILTHPPLLVIEILSPEDRPKRMVKRCEDYLQFGIENVWIIDPQSKQGWYCSSGGTEAVENGEMVVDGTPIRVVLSDLFAELDAV